MVKYIAYLRKSTDEKKRQVLSLISQKRVTDEIAAHNRLSVLCRISESRTAKEPGRPQFNRMLDRIERGDADGIVCWGIDRLYRNPVDEGRVRWMLQRGIIKSIRTPNREYMPADAGLLMAVEGGKSADFIIDLRRNVARGITDKLLGGGWPGRTPLGYVYDHDRENIVPHPKHGKTITRIYAEFCEGGRSLTWVSDRLAELGFLTKSGEKFSKSKVHHILTNKLYVGIMVWNGKAYDGKYEPLVSPEAYDTAARILKVRSKPRKTRKFHDFPFRGLFRCTCGSMITAQFARGNGGVYRYYRCVRKTRSCSEPYILAESVASQCLRALAPIGLTAAEATFARGLLDELARKGEEGVERDLAAIEESASQVQDQLNNLTRGYARLAIDDDSYTVATTELLLKKKSLRHKKRQLEEEHDSFWLEPAKQVIGALEMAAKKTTERPHHEIALLARKIGTNHVITRKTVSFDWAEPYAYAAQLLAQMPATIADNQLSHDNGLERSSALCMLSDYLRTYFRESLPS